MTTQQQIDAMVIWLRKIADKRHIGNVRVLTISDADGCLKAADMLASLAPDAKSRGRREERQDDRWLASGDSPQGVAARPVSGRGDRRPGPVNGFWGASDWIHCRDERWRPVEPGTFPLAHGAPARVVRLRGYGNGLNAQHATAFTEAALTPARGPMLKGEGDEHS